MVKWGRIRSAFSKPAWRWRGFVRSACIDIAIFIVTSALAIWLVSSVAPTKIAFDKLTVIAVGQALVGVWLLIWRNQYSTQSRYFGLYDVLNISLVATIVGIINAIASRVFSLETPAFEYLAPLLFTFFSFSGLAGRRMIERSLAWRSRVKDGEKSTRLRRTLVVGAGDAGEAIIREVQRSTSTSMEIIGLIDDDPKKQSLRIHGIPVIGTVSEIPQLVDRHAIEEILIAMPRVGGKEIRRVFEISSQTSARLQTLPSADALVGTQKQFLLPQLRTVEITDLLRREAVETNLDEVARYLSGEHVLVTGAGGSIGSELARQIAQMNPASLTLVGKGENSIYEIEQELVQTAGLIPNTIIADVRDRTSMGIIFEKYRPTVVFHAAAHKHVPLMEKNPREAIQNNVQGTFVVAELAVKYGIKKFILISTDKAVKPSSIMGATKRVCEMIVCAFGQSSEVEFAAVRFGNVLGSRGSLIPLLQAQIRRGGPVTITHKDMTRFFMTIPEASQLVLQAGAIGKRGEVFILDMGEPIRILDLAIELIRMYGLVPETDIPIKFTGMRPGEKMHEELVYEKEALQPTSHPKIRMVANISAVNLKQLRRDLDALFSVVEDPARATQFLQDLAWEKNMPPVEH